MGVAGIITGIMRCDSGERGLLDLNELPVKQQAV